MYCKVCAPLPSAFPSFEKNKNKWRWLRNVRPSQQRCLFCAQQDVIAAEDLNTNMCTCEKRTRTKKANKPKLKLPKRCLCLALMSQAACSSRDYALARPAISGKFDLSELVHGLSEVHCVRDPEADASSRLWFPGLTGGVLRLDGLCSREALCFRYKQRGWHSRCQLVSPCDGCKAVGQSPSRQGRSIWSYDARGA